MATPQQGAAGPGTAAAAAPGPESGAAHALLHDALLDLCPTLPAVQALARLADAAFPGGAAERTARLTRALLRAASSGDTDLLSWMLHMRSQGLDARVRAEALLPEARAVRDIDLRTARDDDGTGPLVLASSAGHVDVVHMLVRAGADVDERDPCGWTPLMWATNSSNAPLVAFLLSQGADVEARSVKGTSCEDFILSAAPESSTLPGTALGLPGPSSRARSPGGRSPSAAQRDDRQVVADLVHEQLLRQRRARQRRSGNHLRTLSSASSAGSYGPSTSPTKPSSLLSPHRDSSPERKGPFSPSAFGTSIGTSTSGGEEYGRFRASSLAGAGTRRLVGRNERNQLHEAELRARELAEGRRRALLDVAVMLEVEYSALVGEAPAQAQDESAAHRRRKKGRLGELAPPPPKVAHSGLASGCGAAEVGADPLSAEFIWERVTDDQMLVLGLHDVTPVLDDIISHSKPVRAPWTSRAAPANVVFLCLRFACRFEDEDLLEELMLGAVDRIEACIYAQPYNMTVLAFWLFNCTLLLHYTLRDAGLAASEAMLEFRPLLVDLINEVYVFVIRDAERRIDKIMDAAILDHDAIPGFEEVRFEGEWSFMKNLTGSVKSLSSSAASPGTPASSKRPLSQIFARGTPDPNAPIQQLGHHSSPSGGGGSSQLRAAAEIHSGRRMPSPLPIPPTMREASYDASVSDLLARPSPRTVTSLLTSTLHVLQLYEINPAIIVQALSQIFFWVGCELFNRVLTRKRYLCRSRAMQIRLNISALEDWARSNALPLSVVNAHLSPLSQLVSWLQCQSTLREFVDLIATMQGLRALNPLQLRRAVRDYRFEVGEPHMSAECTQYLAQLQKDWQRAREDAEIEEEDRQREAWLEEQRGREPQRNGKASGIHHRSGTATEYGNTPDSRSPSPPSREGSHAQNLAGLAPAAIVNSPGRSLSSTEALAQKAHDDVDSLFQPGRGIGDYVPPWSAASAPTPRGDAAQKPLVEGAKPGELLNSCDMLPFALPSRAEALIVSPGDAFGFGRGHFQGTGTPSLKSVRGDSLAPGFDGAASPAMGLDSRPVSPSLSLTNGDDARSTGSDEMERGSVASGASSARSGLSAASRSSLFAQGKGIGAGAYWQPVPLLPEGLLDRIDRVARVSAAARPPIEHRLSSLAMTSPVLHAPATMMGVLEQPRPMPTRWESAGSDTFIAPSAPEPKRTRANQYGYDDDDESERASQRSDKENTPQPEVRSPELRQPSTLRAGASPAKDARRRPSGLSAAPNRLVLPGRGYAKSAILGVSESAEEDGDTLATPVDRQSSRPF